MIEVDNISKTYRTYLKGVGLKGSIVAYFNRAFCNVFAVNDITFSVRKGEVVGFLGGNGAGKTTVMKMLAGIIKPSSGQMTVAGFDPYLRKHAYLKSISFVSGQKQQLSWDLTANDSFELNKIIYGVAEQDYKRVKDELVSSLELNSIIDRPVRTLSLGERMKCEIAVSLLHRPRIMFLDEPTIGLDVAMQRVVRSFLADYNKRYGITTLLTSHCMADVEALASRVIILSGGEIVCDKTMGDLLKAYASSKVIKALVTDRNKSFEGEGGSRDTERSERFIEVLVDKEDVSSAILSLSEYCEILDLSVSDESIERVLHEYIKRPK